MIQLKATYLRCGGSGYNPLDTSASEFLPPLHCPDCDGRGTILSTSQNWDISLERVPPFSLEEMEEMRKK
jgi:hypothetical protein